MWCDFTSIFVVAYFGIGLILMVSIHNFAFQVVYTSSIFVIPLIWYFRNQKKINAKIALDKKDREERRRKMKLQQMTNEN